MHLDLETKPPRECRLASLSRYGQAQDGDDSGVGNIPRASLESLAFSPEILIKLDEKE